MAVPLDLHSFTDPKKQLHHHRRRPHSQRSCLTMDKVQIPEAPAPYAGATDSLADLLRRVSFFSSAMRRRILVFFVGPQSLQNELRMFNQFLQVRHHQSRAALIGRVLLMLLMDTEDIFHCHVSYFVTGLLFVPFLCRRLYLHSVSAPLT